MPWDGDLDELLGEEDELLGEEESLTRFCHLCHVVILCSTSSDITVSETAQKLQSPPHRTTTALRPEAS